MKKYITIANFVTDDKFIDGVILFNEKYSPSYVRHIYIYVTESYVEKFNFIDRKDEIIQVHSDEIIQMLFNQSVDAVLLHNIFSVPLYIIPLFPVQFCVIWSSWGFDIYSMIENKLLINIELFGSKTREFINGTQSETCERRLSEIYKKAVSRIDYISTVVPEEYDLIPRLTFFHADQLHYTYITPNEVKKYQSATIPSIFGENILVGNSCSPTNNHLDIFQKLSRVGIGNKKIYCPFSYAGCTPEYKNEVLEQGEKLFGNNFVPLLHFLDKEEYFSVISSCKYVFFGHIRQQALGNMREMLLNGSKVFLNKEGVMYKHFKSRGLHVLSIQDVTKEQLTSHFSREEIQNNIDIMKRYTSPEKYYKEMSLMDEKIRRYKTFVCKRNSIKYILYDLIKKVFHRDQ